MQLRRKDEGSTMEKNILKTFSIEFLFQNGCCSWWMKNDVNKSYWNPSLFTSNALWTQAGECAVKSERREGVAGHCSSVSNCLQSLIRPDTGSGCKWNSMTDKHWTHCVKCFLINCLKTNWVNIRTTHFKQDRKNCISWHCPFKKIFKETSQEEFSMFFK